MRRDPHSGCVPQTRCRPSRCRSVRQTLRRRRPTCGESCRETWWLFRGALPQRGRARLPRGRAAQHASGTPPPVWVGQVGKNKEKGAEVEREVVSDGVRLKAPGIRQASRETDTHSLAHKTHLRRHGRGADGAEARLAKTRHAGAQARPFGEPPLCVCAFTEPAGHHVGPDGDPAHTQVHGQPVVEPQAVCASTPAGIGVARGCCVCYALGST
jgi:hypothetical protein